MQGCINGSVLNPGQSFYEGSLWKSWGVSSGRTQEHLALWGWLPALLGWGTTGLQHVRHVLQSPEFFSLFSLKPKLQITTWGGGGGSRVWL